MHCSHCLEGMAWPLFFTQLLYWAVQSANIGTYLEPALRAVALHSSLMKLVPPGHLNSWGC